MIKFAIYGKGGIGKSTLSSNLSAAFAANGLRVMQIGCDPKADSTTLLRPKEEVTSVLDLVRSKKNFTIEDMVKEAKGAYEKYKPDVVIYDVLGDVVCGGFTMPMRKGYADKVYIVTSGEKMAIYAAANIAMAVENFKSRDYAKLGGIILNCRGVEDEEKRAAELAADFGTDVIATIPRDSIFEKAEAEGGTVVELYPDSEVTKLLLKAADYIFNSFKE